MVRRVLEEKVALAEAAEAAGVSARTVGKWVRRYREEGEAGLLDRSSAPHRVHNLTPPDRVEAIAALRRVRLTGPERIAAAAATRATVRFASATGTPQRYGRTRRVSWSSCAASGPLDVTKM
jgi:transposase-like protein